MKYLIILITLLLASCNNPVGVEEEELWSFTVKHTHNSAYMECSAAEVYMIDSSITEYLGKVSHGTSGTFSIRPRSRLKIMYTVLNEKTGKVYEEEKKFSVSADGNRYSIFF